MLDKKKMRAGLRPVKNAAGQATYLYQCVNSYAFDNAGDFCAWVMRNYPGTEAHLVHTWSERFVKITDPGNLELVRGGWLKA